MNTLEEKEDELEDSLDDNVPNDTKIVKNDDVSSFEKAAKLKEEKCKLQNELEKLLEELKLSKEKVTALESGEIKELNEENQTLKEKIRCTDLQKALLNS